MTVYVVQIDWIVPDGAETGFDLQFCTESAAQYCIANWQPLPNVQRAYVSEVRRT